MAGALAKIQLEKDAEPRACRARKISAPLDEVLARKVKEAKAEGLIEETNEFKGWLHRLVLAYKKSGEARLCIDLRPLNEYVIRQPQPFPTFEELSATFSGATVFSKLDIQDAFHQIELEPESRNLTAFSCSIGTFQFTRLPFGLSSAPEYFQCVMTQKLAGLQGKIVFVDDINVFGKDMEEHDVRLAKVLDKLDRDNIRLNLRKCEFKKERLEFLGYVVDASGLRPSPSKIAALKNCRPPESKAEAQSFLGMVSYLGHRFIPDLATISEPIRRLTQKGAHYDWQSEQQEAFSELINAVEKIATLNFYSLSNKTLLFADASPFGLAGVLAQVDENGTTRPIAFASKSLSKADQRLSQTEKEAMALVWAVENFDYFLRGRSFDLLTDHKPLEIIFKRKAPTSSLTSARIERWRLRIQEYDARVKYVPGKKMIADFLSRAGCTDVETHFDIDTEEAINFIVTKACEAITEEELRQCSLEDTQFHVIREALRYDSWTPAVRKFELIKNELTDVQGILLRGHKIIIPEALRDKVLNIVHEGHPGMCRMKNRLRHKYWWPGMSKDAESKVANCNSCRLVAMSLPAEPLKRTELPDQPWEHIGLDFLGPMPSGEKLLVVVDYFSRFVFVAIMKDTSAHKVIEELQIMCNVYGYPKHCLCDNGPPFASAEFKAWTKSVGILLSHSIPYQPRINGEVERVNRSLVKALTISLNTGEHWKIGLEKFLVSYRQTPHTVTGRPPSELFLRRQCRDKLPSISTLTLQDEVDEELHDRDRNEKQKGKEYADNHYHYRYSDLGVGDLVLMKRQQRTKWQTRNDPTEFVVVERQGPAITIMGKDGRKFIRDISHLTRIGNDKNSQESDSEPIGGDQLNVERSTREAENTENGEQMRDSPRRTCKEGSEEVEENQEEQNFDPITASTPKPSNPKSSARVRKRPDYLLDYTK